MRLNFIIYIPWELFLCAATTSFLATWTRAWSPARAKKKSTTFFIKKWHGHIWVTGLRQGEGTAQHSIQILFSHIFHSHIIGLGASQQPVGSDDRSVMGNSYISIFTVIGWRLVGSAESRSSGSAFLYFCFIKYQQTLALDWTHSLKIFHISLSDSWETKYKFELIIYRLHRKSVHKRNILYYVYTIKCLEYQCLI